MATLIEQRTIGAIPENERHGRAWHLLPLWFSLNATVMAATTGAIGISVGAVAGGLHYVLNRSAAAADADLPVAPITATAAATA